MKRNIFGVIITVIVLALIVYYVSVARDIQIKKPQAVATPTPTEVPALPENLELTETYSHPLGFSFKYPKTFKVHSSSDETGETIVVENEKAQGIQIHIQEIDDPTEVVTIDMIQKNVPDLTIKNPQDVAIGSTGKGVAFLSDNKLFNGNSREVWFAYQKHFYQISTYAAYDSLLKAIFATWQFKR